MEKVICPKCSTENPNKNIYCQACGAALKEETPAAPSAPPSLPAAAAFPPPPPPPVTPAVPRYYGTPLSAFGVRADNWSELIEGESAAAENVTTRFIEELENAEAPGVRIATSDLISGKAAPRPYIVVNNDQGATVAVRIAPLGRDLWVSWDLFTRRTLNWLTIGIWLGAIILLLLVGGIITWVSFGFLNSLSLFFSLALSLVLVTGLGLLLAGKLFKDDIFGMFINDLDDFAMDDAAALSITVDNALIEAIDASLDDEPVS